MRKICPYLELFLTVFSHVWTAYGEILSLLNIQSQCSKMRTRITPNTDTFYAVVEVLKD